jgi:AcrR family transcriptional regulator
MIMRCAAQLFDEHGYHNTRMAEIATAAGIRKATLYHYFASKDEILYWLQDEFIEVLIERQEARRDHPLEPESQLLEIGADILELMDTHRGYARVFFEHRQDLPAPARSMIAAREKHYEHLVSEILSEGVARGSFRPMDVRLSALSFFGMCNWCCQWYDPDGELTGRQIAQYFIEIFTTGIAMRPQGVALTESLVRTDDEPHATRE